MTGFVYNKEGCWLSRYIKKERNESKNQFKNWICQCFDKKTGQYIANFERIESSLDNDLDKRDSD